MCEIPVAPCLRPPVFVTTAFLVDVGFIAFISQGGFFPLFLWLCFGVEVLLTSGNFGCVFILGEEVKR